MIDDFKPVKRPNRPPITRASVPTGPMQPLYAPKIPNDKPEPQPQVAETPPINDDEFRVKTSDHSKRKKILIIIGCILLVAAVGAGAYWWFTKDEAPASTTEIIVEKQKAVEKAKIYSPLSGVEVTDAALTKRPVTGIMIENSTDSRPQSGLDKAGVVFEAIAEGGITRFLALYQDTEPDYIGPVRSARPYYVEWTKMHDASYAHVGGSPDALALIKSMGVKDLDQFSNGNFYYRITSRAAPHNVYTDFTKLDALNEKKGYTSSSYVSWGRKADVPQTPTANTIDVSISSPLYSPRFTYDISTNSYKRAQDGEPHLVLAKDLKTKTQLNPKTVIVMVTTYGIESDGKHSKYRTTGTGKIYVFQDGIVSIGTWSRADTKSQYVFKDQNGLPMLLNRGQTWVSLVGSESAVTYKP